MKVQYSIMVQYKQLNQSDKLNMTHSWNLNVTQTSTTALLKCFYTVFALILIISITGHGGALL